MSGKWRIDPDPIGPHDHLVIETDDGRRLALNDPRRFGSVDMVPTDEVDSWRAVANLGPEPTEIDAAALYDRLRGRTAPIKSSLLDQRLVAGLGNIYACEALHRARIHPLRPVGKLSRARVEALVEAIGEVIADAIEAGGSTLRDYARPDGELGYFSARFLVYGREGACLRVRRDCPADRPGRPFDLLLLPALSPASIDPNRLRL
jgi:formamidopyrimidine-DNA glycosylase